ncbi:ABC-type antimicrobial peptide transport system permease subunit [Algoriphagus ratkowskyi]|uniref:ABC-type antimicrobial peptide transport system permease subunit n=1 Tax=Algoriphagus ratkowskyi TaxID=57028 RepID=A0A2W7REU5_9BACT|nr:FtsX-like permease family protein [Algoriphagus ratkowskyi]PZX57646.1 ABC-type antimicrobial peptide transport system permease subunit [Algoriphagus ratkowskyi]TXD78917.1 FtsX-like permease family protein [Algoriphagus ratkowskyi]
MDSKLKYFPPKWPDRFLEFYCNPNRLEQIQGDAYELFYINLEEKGLAFARFRFLIHVLSFFRWSNIKRSKSTYHTFSQGAMLKNYFKIGWRNLVKQKGTTFISVFGLACAVGCCMVAYLFIANIWFKGMHQPNKDEIYQLTYTVEEEKGMVTYGAVAAPISELIPETFNQLVNHTRVSRDFSILISKNESYNQRTLFVDPAFMEMFIYRMDYGYPGALLEPDQVILTHELSEKLYGNTHPIGQELSLVVNGEEKLYTVGGVLADLHDMDMFTFDLLVNIDTHPNAIENLPLKDAWNSEVWTFVQVEEGADIANLNTGLAEITSTQNKINPEKPYLKLETVAFTDLVYRVDEIKNGVRDFLGLGPQILLGAIGLFILILAVFNYINISVLMASRRLKEIGVRKVIGSRRSQLVFQFLSENLMVCFIAIFLGCLLAGFIFLPGFNEIASKNLKIELFRDSNVWMFLGGMLLFITLVSGLYPALYVSSFKHINILKGNQKIGSKSVFTSVLLTFQFMLAFISIVAGVAFVQTNYLNENRDWGYDSADKIIVNVPSSEDYLPLKNKLLALASVNEVSGSQDYVGNWIREGELIFQDEKFEISLLNAEANYPEVLDLKLKQGRLFNPELISDMEESIVVNQTFLDELGLTFPVSEKITFDSASFNVVGVVEDFHTIFFQSPIAPIVIRASPDTTFSYLTLKMTTGSAESSMEAVKEIWHETIPRGLFEGKLQTEVFEREFSDVRGVQNIILFAAILAVVLASLGLFGLVSLNMTSDIKDYCVRKVFGANLGDLSKKMGKRYFIIWGIASVLGGAFSLLIISSFLDSFFAFHSGVGAFQISIGLLILLLVIAVTVGSQIWKIMKANPATILKAE